MNRAKVLLTLLLVVAAALAFARLPRSVSQDVTPTPGSAWNELAASMETMHAAMTSVSTSQDNDIDFVRLMLPHHQAAIDMARVQLMYGKDPQMRRLAQEIITDQQSEIDLMKLWLNQHGSTVLKGNNKNRMHPNEEQ